MIIGNKNSLSVSFFPLEYESELIINADAIISGGSSFQRFQTVRRWDTKISQIVSSIQQIQFAESGRPHRSGNRPSGFRIHPIEQIFRGTSLKTVNHYTNIRF